MLRSLRRRQTKKPSMPSAGRMRAAPARAGWKGRPFHSGRPPAAFSNGSSSGSSSRASPVDSRRAPTTASFSSGAKVQVE